MFSASGYFGQNMFRNFIQFFDMSSASGYIGAKYFAAFAPLHALLLCCMSLGTRETCSSHDPLVAILLKNVKNFNDQ